MAMKFVKSLLIFTCVLCLVNCGSAPTKNVDNLSAAKVDLLSSEQFIPVIQMDKEGLPIAYERKIDPYSAQKGRIDKNAIVAFIESKRQFQAGNYDKATSLSKALSESSPKLSGPWIVIGDIALAEKQVDEAEAAYAKAITINEDSINAYLKLALLQRQQGKYLIAQNTYVAALERWSDFPEAHLNLAILYDLYLNHPIRAQRHFEAYEFLTDGRDQRSSAWLAEVTRRTGLAPKLKLGDDVRPEIEGELSE